MRNKVYLRDHLVTTGDGGYCLPHSKVQWFTRMDHKGNLKEKKDPPSSPWPVLRSSLRAWGRLIYSMQRETPRSYGGHRHGVEPMSIEKLRHERRVDEILARILRPDAAERMAA